MTNPTDPVTLRAVMADGAEHECVTTERMYMCLADRVQFERRFGVSFGELRLASAAGVQHDEWIAFFVWRGLSRGVPALSQTSFDDFVEATTELEIIRASDEATTEPEEAAPDPTGEPEAAPDPTPREPARVP